MSIYTASTSDQSYQVKKRVGKDPAHYRSYNLANSSADFDHISSTSFSNVPSSLLSSLVQYQAFLPNGLPAGLSHMAIRVNLSVSSSSVRLPPTPYWFKKITLTRPDGSLMKQWYPDILFQQLMTAGNRDQMEAMAEYINADPRQDSFCYAGPTIPSGATRTFYLPLPYFVGNLPFATLDGSAQWQLTFYPQDSQIAVSGSGVVSVNSMSIHFDVMEAVYRSDVEHHQHLKQSVQEAVICQEVQLPRPGTTLTAGTTNNIPLDAFVGKACQICVIVKPSGISNASNALSSQWVELGAYSHASNATIDLINNQGVSLYGNGSPVPMHHNLLENLTDGSCSNFLRKKPGAVWLNFSKNTFKSCFQGSVKGFLEFPTGHKHQLQLNLPSAPVQTVLNIATTTTSSTGTGTISWKGGSVAGVDFNTPSALASAFNSLPYCMANNITGVFSQSITANATATLTLTHLYSDVPVQFADGNDLPMFDSNVATQYLVCTVGTYGQVGFTSGTYDVFVYVMQYMRAYALGSDIRVESL